jgi:hypothetical protein
MRRLEINGNRVDLDNKTAIGITFQSGDISQPDKKKFTISNTFKIPVTNHNKKILGFSESPYTTTTTPYTQIEINYWDSNIHLIQNGKGFLKQATNQYEIVVVSDGNVIDMMKNKLLRDLMRDSFTNLGSGYTTWSNMLADILNNNTGGYCLNLWALQVNNFLTGAQLMDGHFGMRVSKVFEWISTYTGYQLVNSGSITDDSSFNKLSIPYYDVIPYKQPTSNFNIYLYDDPTVTSIYSTSIVDSSYTYYGDKTVLDLVKAVAVMFNCIIDINETNKTIKLIRFNDIVTSGTVNDWTGKVIESEKQFSIGEYKQQNIIDYLHDESVSEDLGRVIIPCLNTNLDLRKDFKLDVMLPRSAEYNDGGSPTPQTFSAWFLGSTDTTQVTFTTKPLENIVMLIDDVVTNNTYNLGCTVNTGSTLTQQNNLTQVQAVGGYDFAGEYSELKKILETPVGYKTKMDLKNLDIHTFAANELYKVNELGGTFYVMFINGYNSLSRQGTNVQLIKVK